MTAGDLRNRAPLRWQWGWLDLPPAREGGKPISPSDIDAVLHYRHRFLAFELKPAASSLEDFDKGQLILLHGLAAQPGWTVWIVYGDTEGSVPFSWQQVFANGQVGSRKDTDRARFRDRVLGWMQAADEARGQP